MSAYALFLLYPHSYVTLFFDDVLLLLVALPRTPVLIKSYHSYKFLERKRGLFTFTLHHNFYHFYLQLSTIGIFIMLSVLPLFTCLIHLWRVFGISLFPLQPPYSFAHVLSGIYYNLIIENVVAFCSIFFQNRKKLIWRKSLSILQLNSKKLITNYPRFLKYIYKIHSHIGMPPPASKKIIWAWLASTCQVHAVKFP